MRRSARLGFAVPFLLLACQQNDDAAIDAQRATLIGRWARQLADGSWGDTLELHPDGSVTGSVDNHVPPEAHWTVKQGALHAKLFCAGDAKESYCQSYRFVGHNLLILDDGPLGQTNYRRVR